MADPGRLIGWALDRTVAPGVDLLGIAEVELAVVGSRIVAGTAFVVAETGCWELVAWNVLDFVVDVLLVVGSGFGPAAVVQVGIGVHLRDGSPGGEHLLIPFPISVLQTVCPVPRGVRVSRGGLRLKKTSVPFG